MDTGRIRGYDYAVLGLFALVLIGVSLSWYTVSISFADQSLAAGSSGWHNKWGVLAFVFALIAAVFVSVRAGLGASGPSPAREQGRAFVLGSGILVTLFAFIAFLDKPGAGVDLLGFKIGYGPGLYVTLVAGLLMCGCGLLPRTAKGSPAAGPSPARPATPGGAWQVAPWQPPDWQGPGPAAGPATRQPERTSAPVAPSGPGRTSPAEGSPTHCPGCGTQLEPGSRFCRSCGKPQA